MRSKGPGRVGRRGHHRSGAPCTRREAELGATLDEADRGPRRSSKRSSPPRTKRSGTPSDAPRWNAPTLRKRRPRNWRRSRDDSPERPNIAAFSRGRWRRQRPRARMQNDGMRRIWRRPRRASPMVKRSTTLRWPGPLRFARRSIRGSWSSNQRSVAPTIGIGSKRRPSRTASPSARRSSRPAWETSPARATCSPCA